MSPIAKACAENGDVAVHTAASSAWLNPALTRDTAGTEYEDANHEPIVKVDGPNNISAKAGEKIKFKAVVEDHDPVKIKWWQFNVGTYPGQISIKEPTVASIEVGVPMDAQKGQTIHLIIEATDQQLLTRYQRVIVTVK